VVLDGRLANGVFVFFFALDLDIGHCSFDSIFRQHCNLTGGHVCSKAMSRFVIKTASFNVFPFTHSLATDEEAVRVTKEAARQLSLRGSSFLSCLADVMVLNMFWNNPLVKPMSNCKNWTMELTCASATSQCLLGSQLGPIR